MSVKKAVRKSGRVPATPQDTSQGATRGATRGAAGRPRNLPGLSDDDLRQMLRTMKLIRQFEDRMLDLFLQQKIKGTAHSCVGQEAIATGVCQLLRREDFVVSNHRGHGHCIAKGADLDRMAAELFGRRDGYCRGLGGSMHIADLDLNILGANGIVAAGLGLGIGAALAARQRGSDHVGVVFFGDGASNEGLFHEALNIAGIWKLPVVFVCENNQYGLTGRQKDMTAGGSIARRADAYGMPGELVDGNDILAVHAATEHAVLAARNGEGPSLIEALTYRWGGHSMRSNLPRYRPEDEEQAWIARDPIARFSAELLERGVMSAADQSALDTEIGAAVDRAVDFGFASGLPLEEECMAAVTTPLYVCPAPAPARTGTRLASFAQAINEALHHEMAADERVFVLGEDIARIGGLFQATKGLLDRFGPLRALDTPIAEAGGAGVTVGAAIAGQRPVMELQFFDFVTNAMDMIVNQAAKFRFMLGGKPRVPLVIRSPQGSGIRVGAQHSQSLEAWFAHVPGLVVVAPSDAYDAKGLLTSAIRDDNPVLFLEHKLLYQAAPVPVPEESYALPLGKAFIKRAGSDVTVVTYSGMVERAMGAAQKLEREGISVEVVDVATLKPLDMDTIVASVRKTNRCVVVHEACRTGGIGGEIAAQIMEQAFDWLDAPVQRLGGRDVPMPYNDELERIMIPTQADIVDAVRAVLYRTAA